jgi:hypothetical protein
MGKKLAYLLCIFLILACGTKAKIPHMPISLTIEQLHQRQFVYIKQNLDIQQKYILRIAQKECQLIELETNQTTGEAASKIFDGDIQVEGEVLDLPHVYNFKTYLRNETRLYLQDVSTQNIWENAK